MNQDLCKEEWEAYHKATREYIEAKRMPIRPPLSTDINEKSRDAPETRDQSELPKKLDEEADQTERALIAAQAALDKCEKKHGLR